MKKVGIFIAQLVGIVLFYSASSGLVVWWFLKLTE